MKGFEKKLNGLEHSSEDVCFACHVLRRPGFRGHVRTDEIRLAPCLLEITSDVSQAESGNVEFVCACQGILLFGFDGLGYSAAVCWPGQSVL